MISDGSVLNRIYFLHAWRGALPRMAWPATAESTAIYRASSGGCRIDFRSERTKHTPVHALPAFRASLIILLHGYRECSCSWNEPWSERHSILEKSWFIRSKTQSPLDRQALGHSFSRCPLSFFLFLCTSPSISSTKQTRILRGSYSKFTRRKDPCHDSRNAKKKAAKRRAGMLPRSSDPGRNITW